MRGQHSAKSLWARRRFWLALTLSLGLHLIFLPDLGLETDEKSTRVILATLKTEVPERANDNEQRGELSTASQSISTPPEPEPAETPEPAREPEPATAPLATQKPVRPQAPATADTITTTASSEITQKSDAPKPIPSVKSSPTPDSTKPDSTKPDSQARTIEQPAANIISSTASEQARFAGDDQRFSDPVEQKYYERLMAHLNQKLPAHPAGIQGDVRLQVTIKYGAVITAVDVIVSSGDSATDEWARRAILATSPVPAVPSDLPQPYLFRPTLRLTD